MRAFRRYYSQHRILTDDLAVKQARLAVLESVRIVIKDVLRLLGLVPLENVKESLCAQAMMQSARTKGRKQRRRQAGHPPWMVAFSVLFIGMGMGSGITFYWLKQQTTIAPIAVKKQVVSQPSVTKTQYDFYTIGSPAQAADQPDQHHIVRGYLLQVGAHSRLDACHQLQKRLAKKDCL